MFDIFNSNSDNELGFEEANSDLDADYEPDEDKSSSQKLRRMR